MSTVDKALLDEVSRVFYAKFLNADLGSVPGFMDLVTELRPCRGSDMKLKFATRRYGVQEFLGEAQYDRLKTQDLTVAIKKWQTGLDIELDTLEDDLENLSAYQGEINALRMDFEEHRWQLIVDLLNGGFAATKGLAYDGQFFFDTDHDVSQSNKGTAVLTAAAYEAAESSMMAIVKPDGTKAGVRPTHIIVPRQLLATARNIFGRQELTGSGTNTLYNAVQILVEPRLSSATAWFLLDSSKPLKPFIMGDRRAPVFRTSTDPNDPVVRNKGIVEYTADARYNAAFGFWQVMFGSDGTV